MLSNLVILLLLCGLGFFAYRAWKMQAHPKQEPAPPSVSQATVEQLQPGAMIHLPPYGEAMEERDVQITARHIYLEDGFEWLEFEGESSQGTVWLDVERDDELEASVSLNLLQLGDIGLAPDALEQTRSGDRKTVQCEGQDFRFTERGQATFFAKGDRSKPETLEYWDFEGADERRDLGIERWGQQYRVYLTQRIDPARIRIYSLGEPS